MTSFIAAYSLVSINVVFIACSLVSAEVVLRSLRGLVLVKKDSLSVGVLDSCQVLGSTVPASESLAVRCQREVLSSMMPAAGLHFREQSST